MAAFVTNSCLSDIIGAWTASATRPKYLQAGTGAGAGIKSPDPITPVQARVLGSTSQQTTNVDGDTYRVTGTVAADAARTISEVGVYPGASGGAMDIYGDFAGIPLNSGDRINFGINVVAGPSEIVVPPEPPTPDEVTVDLVANFGGSLQKWNQFYQSTFGNMIANYGLTKGAGNEVIGGQIERGWTKFNTLPIDLDFAVLPDGTPAIRMVEDGTPATAHCRAWDLSLDGTYADIRASCTFKSLSGGFCGIIFETISGTPSSYHAIYDLTSGTVVSSGVKVGPAVISSVPPPVNEGNGYFNCKLIGRTNVNNIHRIYLCTSDGVTADSVNGIGRSLLLAKPQLVIDSVAYRPGTIAVLTIPGGLFGAVTGNNILAQARAPDQRCRIEGVGPTTRMLLSSHFGNRQQSPDVVTQPRIKTASAGQNFIELKVIADHACYYIGQWIFICALDMQGFGYPANNAFAEFRRITGINRATGVITLDQGLENTYKETYPLWNDGDDFSTDQGGSATVMAIQDGWGQTVEVQDLNIANTSADAAFGGAAKSVTFSRGQHEGFSFDPSESQRVVFNDWGATDKEIEVDKSVRYLEYNNPTPNIHILHNQSAGNNVELVINGGAITQITGTPTRTRITGTAIGTLFFGAHSYGASQSLELTNVSCPSANQITARGCVSDHALLTSINTGGLGILTLPKPKGGQADQINDLIPGGWYGIATGKIVGPIFQILDVWEDATNSYYQTTLSGTVAQIASAAFSANSIAVHPCPYLTVINSSGCQFMNSYNGKGMVAFGEWFDTGVVTPADFPIVSTDLFGTFVNAHMTVTKAYTGAKAGLKTNFFQFGNELFPDHLISGGDFRWGKDWSLMSTYDQTLLPTDVGGPGANQFWLQQTVTMKLYDGSGNDVTTFVKAEAPSVWPELRLRLTLDQGIT